ncbi:hypothetical protein FHR59_002302 [Xanthomonas arboricola]|nr:hypothetical protein [Xanthomonas arboricola]
MFLFVLYAQLTRWTYYGCKERLTAVPQLRLRARHAQSEASTLS